MKVEEDSQLGETKSFSSSSSYSTSSTKVKVKIFTMFGNYKQGEEAFGEELIHHLISRATKLLLREEWNEFV